METSVAGSARFRSEAVRYRRHERDRLVPVDGERRGGGASPWATVLHPAAALLAGIPRTARRLFDRVGMGLRTFDDNLWDGGDEA